MVAAGVTKKRIHDLRWTMISIAASKGLEQNMVREQAGHSKAYMTSAYTKIFKKDRHTGLAKLNSAVYEVHKKCIDPSDLAPKLKSKESRTLPIEGFIEWGGRGSNPRPTDYESVLIMIVQDFPLMSIGEFASIKIWARSPKIVQNHPKCTQMVRKNSWSFSNFGPER